MKLSELIYSFDMDYLLECSKRNAKRIDFTNPHKALMLSKAVSDIQKNFGVIECSLQMITQTGNNLYGLSNSFMVVKSVIYNGYPLQKTTTEDILSSVSPNSSPTKYTIQYLDDTASLLLYPTPANNTDTILVQGVFDYTLYSPSTNNNDFGKFDGSTFSGNTVFPSQYDRLILLGMQKQIFNDIEEEYRREKLLLMAKQFNGQNLNEYRMTGVIGAGCPGTPRVGVVINQTSESDMLNTLKYVLIQLDSDIPTILKKSGYGVITVSYDSNLKTLTVLSVAEFSVRTFVEPNQKGTDFYWINTSKINITPPDNYGTLVVKIYQDI